MTLPFKVTFILLHANNVIKLRILMGGTYPEFSRWALHAITSILIRHRQREFWNTGTHGKETHREEGESV